MLRTNDDALGAVKELLEWLRSLRLTGACEYMAVLDIDGPTSSSTGSPKDSASFSKLPSLIRHAKLQIQAVIAAQQEIISDQRRSVREKENALLEAENKVKHTYLW